LSQTVSQMLMSYAGRLTQINQFKQV